MVVADEEDVVARVVALTAGRLADAVVDVSPVAIKPVPDAIEIVRNGDTVVLAGVNGGPSEPIDNDRLVFKSITLRAFSRSIPLLSPGHTAAVRGQRSL